MLTIGEDGFVLAEIGFIVVVMAALMLGSFLLFCLRDKVFQINAKVDSHARILEKATTILKDQNASIRKLDTRLNEWDSNSTESESDTNEFKLLVQSAAPAAPDAPDAPAAPAAQSTTQAAAQSVTSKTFADEIVDDGTFDKQIYVKNASDLFPVDVLLTNVNTETSDTIVETVFCYEPTEEELICVAECEPEHCNGDEYEAEFDLQYCEEREDRNEDPSDCFERLGCTPDQIGCTPKTQINGEWIEMHPIKDTEYKDTEYKDVDEPDLNNQNFESDEELEDTFTMEFVNSESAESTDIISDVFISPDKVRTIFVAETPLLGEQLIEEQSPEEQLIEEQSPEEQLIEEQSNEKQLIEEQLIEKQLIEEQSNEEQSNEKQSPEEQSNKDQLPIKSDEEQLPESRVFDEDEISICSSTYKTEKLDNAYKHLPIAVLRNVASSKMPGDDFTKMKKKEIVQVLLKHDDQDM